MGCRLWVLVVLAAGCGRVWFDGWVPSVWDGSGLVYGGARVGVRLVGCGGGVADGVVLGVVWSGRAGVLPSWLSRLRVRRVCSRLWMTAAMSTASVWAARPNAADRWCGITLFTPFDKATSLNVTRSAQCLLTPHTTVYVTTPT